MQIGCWTAVAMLISAAALAAPVQYYVNVQPIDVCSTDGSSCAPVNEPGTTGVGFFNSAGTDITRAILNQAGIDVNYLPTQFIFNSAFQSLLVTPGNTPGQLTSQAFQMLSDQPAISQGSPPTPAPPLASNANTVNVFFVNSLTDGAGVTGVLYGLTWIGNNGTVIDQAAFGTSARGQIINAVPDVVAHEIIHDLGLDHPTDNSPQAMNNLMSAVRTEPTIAGAINALSTAAADQLNVAQIQQVINPNGGPLNTFLNPVPGVTTTVSSPDPILVGQCIEFAVCWTGPGPTPWSDTLSTANLVSLGLGTTQPFVAAQTSEFVTRLGATTITFDTPTGPTTESLAQFNGSPHSDPCNFCEIDTVGDFTIPANATDATISGTFGNSAVSTSAGVDLCLGAGPPCAPTPTANDFTVAFQNPGRAGESLLSLTLMAPAGVLFDPALFAELNFSGDTTGITLTPSFLNCGEFTGPSEGVACQELQLAFSGNPFMLGDQVDYTVGFCLIAGADCAADSNINDLAGGTYTYDFSDGYQTTSALALVNGVLTASSQDPDPSAPTNLNLALFTPFSTQPCVPEASTTTCPPLVIDGDFIEDLVFQSAVPEPPSGAILVAGLAIWFALVHRHRSRGSARLPTA